MNLLLSLERISVLAWSSLMFFRLSPSTLVRTMPAETPASAAAEPGLTEMTRKLPFSSLEIDMPMPEYSLAEESL